MLSFYLSVVQTFWCSSSSACFPRYLPNVWARSIPCFWRWRRFSQSLCDIADIRSISILFIAVITVRVIGSDCEGSLSDRACHDVGTSRLTIRNSCCSICFFSVIRSLLLKRVRRSICSTSKISLRWLSIGNRSSSRRSSLVPLMFSRS